MKVVLDATDKIVGIVPGGGAIPNQPSSSSPFPGVAFRAPPMLILADATRILTEMTKALPADAHGAVIGIATEADWNAAVVHRVGDHFQVASWVGKTWGSGLTGGAAIRATW